MDIFGRIGAPQQTVDPFRTEPLDPASDLGRAMQAGGTLNAFISTLNTGYNAVMNGEFLVWQRGTSFTSAAHLTWLADRWRLIKLITGATMDISRSGETPGSLTSPTRPGTQGFRYSLLVTGTGTDTSVGSTDLVTIRQHLYPPQWMPMARRDCVLSFWVRSSKIGVYSVGIRDGSSGQIGCSVEYVIQTANTWEYKQVRIPACPADVSSLSDYAELHFVLMAGSSYQVSSIGQWYNTGGLVPGTANQVNFFNEANTFYLTGVQLEVGSVATKFQHLGFHRELLECMRWFQKSFNYAQAPANGVNYLEGAAVGPQIVGASTAQPIALWARLPVPMYSTQGVGGGAVVTNYYVAGGAGGIRNVSAGVDCTGTTILTNGANPSDRQIIWTCTTPAGSAAGQILALHWAIDSEAVN